MRWPLVYGKDPVLHMFMCKVGKILAQPELSEIVLMQDHPDEIVLVFVISTTASNVFCNYNSEP